MKLFIVESPGKIKKLSQILGSEYRVMASMGHIRELSNDGDDSLGFTFEGGKISCRYIPRSTRAKKVISELKSAAQNASEVLLASDPDREGETIAWHLSQVLGLKQPKRVVYQEITDAAVKRGISHSRAIDLPLVEAGRCRDCLDKLVGYRGSPLVWRLNNGAKSVGRVQSATLHLVCQREREIEAFVAQDYWSVYVDYGEGFRAFYRGLSQVAEKEDDPEGSETPTESSRVLSQAEADRFVEIARNHPHQVLSVEGKQTSKNPPAAFTTSSLQQAAGSRLKFSPEHTMQVAQKLYEAGLITYMRTDSVQLSPEFCASVRQWLEAKDPDNVPAKVAQHRSGKAAQEAHEAVRPTDVSKSSVELKTHLSEDEFQLYVLIWKRAVATQCKPAEILKSQIVTQSGEICWQAKGQVVQFPGYGKYWQDISADALLPTVIQGQNLSLTKAGYEQKQTQPPPRYTEPKLVQLMERKGIGRPSTYAPTIATLKERQYVSLNSGKLEPTRLGMEVDGFMLQALPDLLQAEFTAQMESSLDAIAEGKQQWEQYLTHWNQSYFEPALKKAQNLLPEQSAEGKSRPALERSQEKCPGCSQALSKVPYPKVKKGYFLKCEHGCRGEDGRELVMFWSDYQSVWKQLLPKAESSASPTSLGKLTQYQCPVCKKPLAEISYTKDGQNKQMLKCSGEKAKNTKHKGVVYFQSKGAWWSPKYGNLAQE